MFERAARRSFLGKVCVLAVLRRPDKSRRGMQECPMPLDFLSIGNGARFVGQTPGRRARPDPPVARVIMSFDARERHSEWATRRPCGPPAPSPASARHARSAQCRLILPHYREWCTICEPNAWSAGSPGPPLAQVTEVLRSSRQANEASAAVSGDGPESMRVFRIWGDQ